MDLKKRFRSIILHRVVVLCVYSILIILHCLRPFKTIRFLLVSEYRIGGFTPKLDLYLRRKKYEGKSSSLDIAIIQKPANYQLLEMFKHHMHIFESKWWVRLLNHNMNPGQEISNRLKKSRFMYRLPLPTSATAQIALKPPVVHFTELEEKRGLYLLTKMGLLKEDWFVCFQSREIAYYKTIYAKGQEDTYVRNSSISSYIEAMKYISECGGYAVRLGAGIDERLPNLRDPHIIDYASDFRTDFGDIYLLAKCRFFVGCNGGLNTVAMMFNTPIVDTNSLIMPTRGPEERVWAIPLTEKDIFLPRPIYSRSKGRLLTFEEKLEPPVRFFALSHEYEEAGLDVLENSPEEILGVTRLMHERLLSNA